MVTGDRVVPKLIKHENLFSLLPESRRPLWRSRPGRVGDRNYPTAAAAEISSKGANGVDAALQSPAAAPLRILVTRRTEPDEIIDMQYLLALLGYLKPQNFSGRTGDETQTAVKAFQKGEWSA